MTDIDKLLRGFSPPPQDTVDVYVELDQKDLHFVDDVIKGYDGVANVRREYRVHKGQKQFRLLVPPCYVEKVREILRSLRSYIYIGEIIVEGTSNGC